jgi:hypothetical protein
MEIVPRTARVMYLFNPPTAPFAERFFEPFKAAASSIGVEAVASSVYDPAEIEAVLAGFARAPDSGLVVVPSAFMGEHRHLVIAGAERYRLPAIYPFRYYAESGGLVSYGNVPRDAYRQAATCSSRGKAGRSSGSDVGQVRVDRESQNREGDGAKNPRVLPCPRRNSGLFCCSRRQRITAEEQRRQKFSQRPAAVALTLD